MTTSNPTDRAHSHLGWSVSYTQRDVETIRQQIGEEQAARRRLLVVALLITVAALVGALILLSTSYGLYAKADSERRSLSESEARLKSQADEYKRRLDEVTSRDEAAAELKAQAEARVKTLLPGVLGSAEEGRGAGALAQMVFQMPDHRLELQEKPPDSLFRNWHVSSGPSNEVYTLVGGFVDGKWVMYSNLVAKTLKREG